MAFWPGVILIVTACGFNVELTIPSTNMIRLGGRRITILALLLVLGCFGCDEPRLKRGPNWIPKAVGGPLETRPLPPATSLASNYAQWITSSAGPKVRLYELFLESPVQQTQFEFEVRRGETPVGRPLTSFASFIFSTAPTNSYRVEWMAAGNQDSNFVSGANGPKRFLVRLTQVKDTPLPRLQIVAIEGIESPDQVVAINETSVP
jgi:hypothetical protein